MTINCNLTEADYRAMRKYVLFHYRKVHWFLGVVLIPLLVFVWFSNRPDVATRVKIASLVGVIVLWVILLVIFYVAWKIIARFTGGGFRVSVGPQFFDIGDDA